MTSSSQPEPTAGASSLKILFWDSDVYSFLRISQVAQTEWLPVSPKSPGIWLQTKFARGQNSASPQPRWHAEGKDSEVPWLREQLQTCILVSDFLKDSGTDPPLFRWPGGEDATGLPRTHTSEAFCALLCLACAQLLSPFSQPGCSRACPSNTVVGRLSSWTPC